MLWWCGVKVAAVNQRETNHEWLEMSSKRINIITISLLYVVMNIISHHLFNDVYIM